VSKEKEMKNIILEKGDDFFLLFMFYGVVSSII